MVQYSVSISGEVPQRDDITSMMASLMADEQVHSIQMNVLNDEGTQTIEHISWSRAAEVSETGSDVPPDTTATSEVSPIGEEPAENANPTE